MVASPSDAQTEPLAYDDAYYDSNDQAGDRPALAFYARAAGRLAPRGARVLDFGCGTGHFSRRLARRFESWAIDHSSHARTQTANTSPSTTVVAELDELQDASFDLVCTLHVLEHIPDPTPTLERFASLLRPGGRLMYVVPNPEGWGHRRKGPEWFAFRDETHCSLFSTGRWLELTRDAGFEVERTAADGLWDPPYVKRPRLPLKVQLAFFGLPAAIQMAAGRLLLPATWGECLVVVARRP